MQTLSADIGIAFPGTTGFSVRNLQYMSQFAREIPDFEFVQTVSAQLPWSHNTALLDKVKDANQREWYANETIRNGWSLNVMIHQIEADLFGRQVSAKKLSNFPERLDATQGELAVQRGA